MFNAIYVENEIEGHPLSQSICKRYSDVPHISCKRYGEVFNRKAQNFRLQKQAPALILAKKFGNCVLKTPKGYGIGGDNNFYFSHMLNCIFDCRYCFLQGMYRSGNYVVFVNTEDFQQAIHSKIQEMPNEDLYFFSGYDCDSLALESVTHFVENFLPFFEKHPRAYLELRTKSTNINFLLKRKSLSNVIVAYTLTPREISKALEHKTPSFDRRIEALQKLQDRGWPIGLRFDPIIFCDDYEKHYREFFADVFKKINVDKIHSVSLGPFRLPKGIYKNMTKLYPDEKLFAHSLDDRGDTVSYQNELEEKLINFCTTEVLKYIPKSIFFPCEVNI